MPPLYDIVGADRQLSAPVLVAAFDGWVDAAGAASAAGEHLVREAEVVARFDPDALYDYRSRRPVLDILDGQLHELTFPETTVRRLRLGERDVLVLSGAEPDFRWRELADSALELSLRLGVVEWVSVGAIPAAVPHTRPTHVVATESKPGLLRSDEQQRIEGMLRVPSAALSVMELTVSASGIPSVGFYAQVPHYVGGPYAAATIALLERLESHLEVPISLGELVDQAASQRSQLDEVLAERPDTRAYIEQLESAADQEVPSGDEIAAEIERFLRGQGGQTGRIEGT
jgi:PAC2 family protein